MINYLPFYGVVQRLLLLCFRCCNLLTKVLLRRRNVNGLLTVGLWVIADLLNVCLNKMT